MAAAALLAALFLLSFSPQHPAALSLEPSNRPRVVDATVQIHHLTVQRGARPTPQAKQGTHPLRSAWVDRFVFALFRVDFDRDVAVVRRSADYDGGADLPLRPLVEEAKGGGYNEDTTLSTYGLTRLVCGDEEFAGHPRSRRAQARADAGIQTLLDDALHLVPLNEMSSVFPHELLLSAPNLLPQPSESKRSFVAALLLEAALRSGGNSRRNLLEHASVLRCELEIIAPPLQTWLSEIPAELRAVGRGSDNDVPFTGRIAFRPHDYADGRATGTERAPVPTLAFPAMSFMDVEKALSYAHSVYESLPGEREELPHEPELLPRAISVLEESERSLVRQRLLGPVDGAVEGIVQGMADPLTEEVSQGLGDSMSGTLQDQLGQGVEGSLTDQLMQKLVPQVNQMLSEGFPSSVTEALAASLEDKIPQMMEKAVSQAVSLDVSQRLQGPVTESVVSSVPLEAEEDIPEHLGLDMLRPFVHSVSRSLAQSIVPAAISALQHSPSQDYICYACFNENKYCQFCHYESVQTFYGEFYAAEFSAHVTDYYADYYHNYFQRILEPTWYGGHFQRPHVNDRYFEAEYEKKALGYMHYPLLDALPIGEQPFVTDDARDSYVQHRSFYDNLDIVLNRWNEKKRLG